MTYFVEEYLAAVIRETKLCPGVDITIDFHGEYKEDDISVYIFWHKPSMNVGWYPICQIDCGTKSSVFHREGYECSDYWNKLLEDAASWIETHNFAGKTAVNA